MFHIVLESVGSGSGRGVAKATRREAARKTGASPRFFSTALSPHVPQGVPQGCQLICPEPLINPRHIHSNRSNLGRSKSQLSPNPFASLLLPFPHHPSSPSCPHPTRRWASPRLSSLIILRSLWPSSSSRFGSQSSRRSTTSTSSTSPASEHPPSTRSRMGSVLSSASSSISPPRQSVRKGKGRDEDEDEEEERSTTARMRRPRPVSVFISNALHASPRSDAPAADDQDNPPPKRPPTQTPPILISHPRPLLNLSSTTASSASSSTNEARRPLSPTALQLPPLHRDPLRPHHHHSDGEASERRWRNFSASSEGGGRGTSVGGASSVAGGEGKMMSVGRRGGRNVLKKTHGRPEGLNEGWMWVGVSTTRLSFDGFEGSEVEGTGLGGEERWRENRNFRPGQEKEGYGSCADLCLLISTRSGYRPLDVDFPCLPLSDHMEQLYCSCEYFHHSVVLLSFCSLILVSQLLVFSLTRRVGFLPLPPSLLLTPLLTPSRFQQLPHYTYQLYP